MKKGILEEWWEDSSASEKVFAFLVGSNIANLINRAMISIFL
ncbi:hypothetical protein [Enterococcus sp. HY326]|nr:hypothetical protein [Enterococcus sp. HY326]